MWTVWDTTLDKIAKDHAAQPSVLLTLLAHFKGTIIQDEMFCLAAVGMSLLDDELAEEIPPEIRRFFEVDQNDWDSFDYRQSRDVLVRYSLLQRIEGQWPGVAMHKLVQWRAEQREGSRLWRWWYTILVLAACCRQINDRDKPEFQRHLIVHIPDVAGRHDWGGDGEERNWFIKTKFSRMFYEEGRWDEAETLGVQVMETFKTKLGVDHPNTLMSISNLALTYQNQGRWDEAETLEVQVMETFKTKLGVDHPSTITSMGNLALTLRNQGRWDEAETLGVQVIETSKTKLGVDHPSTLLSMANLASTWKSLGRHTDAFELMQSCVLACQRVLGRYHPDTMFFSAALDAWKRSSVYTHCKSS